MVDPPSGWMFGFPKAIPNFDSATQEKELIQWFIDNNYPKHLIKQGCLRHCRYWEEEIED